MKNPIERTPREIQAYAHNTILGRLIENEKAVKGLIYNMIQRRMSGQDTYLNVDDIFQDISLLCSDTDKISKRFHTWTWEVTCTNEDGTEGTRTALRGFKYLIIEVLRTEVRRKHAFKHTVTMNKKTDKLGRVKTKHTQSLPLFMSLYDNKGNCNVNPQTKHVSHFTKASELMLTFQSILTPSQFEAINLYMKKYTITEITTITGHAGQWLLDSAFKKIRNEFYEQKYDISKLLATLSNIQN